jgi:hypothetical protein
MVGEETKRAKHGRALGVATAGTVILLGMMSLAAAKAEPQMLTGSQMDSVTASGIRVDAQAFARASGRYAVAQARASATTITIGNRIDLGVGFAEGQAFACCGRGSDVAVDSTASSSGDIVHSTTYAFEFKGAGVTLDGEASYFAYGYTAAFLVARSFEDRQDSQKETVSSSRDDVGAWLAPLIRIDRAPRPGAIVTGVELAPALAVGQRWRAIESFLAATPLTIGR